MVRRKLTIRDKEQIGMECCNCGSTEELEYHHIIPICIGGNDINSNMACLCHPCHEKIHYGKSMHKLHSTIIKQGMENAKAKGKAIGRPKTTIDSIPSMFYKYYPMFCNGKINVSEFARLCGMTRATIYKYLNIVENTEEGKKQK